MSMTREGIKEWLSMDSLSTQATVELIERLMELEEVSVVDTEDGRPVLIWCGSGDEIGENE